MSSEPIQAGSATGTPKTFEFTKRKRWADLLVTELADGINLILSKMRVILYCAPVITEMTGWKSADLLGCDFNELLATRRSLFLDDLPQLKNLFQLKIKLLFGILLMNPYAILRAYLHTFASTAVRNCHQTLLPQSCLRSRDDLVQRKQRACFSFLPSSLFQVETQIRRLYRSLMA